MISFPNDVVVEKKVNIKPTVIGTAQEEKKRYAFPPLSLLEDHMEFGKYEINNTTSFQKQERINQFFSDYKIDARVESFTVGPAVTRFNIRTSPGVRISTMASRVEELQMYLRGDKSVRVETVVEGRDTSGIEVGNAEPMIVPFKSVFNKLQQQQNPLTIALGTNIDGNTVTCNLDDLPHLLVAGTTGSGKSVFIHQVIMSLIMRNYPDQLRLILIDPKKVEFTKYQNIPHLFCRIVDDINQATAILNELVNESGGAASTMPILGNDYCAGTGYRVFFGPWETYFLLAEASLYGWNTGTTAEEAYENGVRASFEYFGVSQYADAYLESEEYNRVGTSVNFNHTTEPTNMTVNYVDGYTKAEQTMTYQYPDANRILYKGKKLNDQLTKIITQKYIAQTPYLALEMWNDYRRLGLPFFDLPANERELTGTDMQSTYNPQNYANGQTIGAYPQRMRYPTSLNTADPVEYQHAIELLGGPDNIMTPLWWAKH